MGSTTKTESPADSHTCNAHCRGERHAQVLWTNCPPAQAARGIGGMLAYHGLRLIHCEAAPEARWNPEMEYVDHRPGAPHPTGIPTSADLPYLVIWEPLDD